MCFTLQHENISCLCWVKKKGLTFQVCVLHCLGFVTSTSCLLMSTKQCHLDLSDQAGIIEYTGAETQQLSFLYVCKNKDFLRVIRLYFKYNSCQHSVSVFCVCHPKIDDQQRQTLRNKDINTHIYVHKSYIYAAMQFTSMKNSKAIILLQQDALTSK